MPEITWITYEDGKKEARYYIDPVEDAQINKVAYITYKEISSEQLKEIQTVTTERVQEILSKLF